MRWLSFRVEMNCCLLQLMVSRQAKDLLSIHVSLKPEVGNIIEAPFIFALVTKPMLYVSTSFLHTHCRVPFGRYEHESVGFILPGRLMNTPAVREHKTRFLAHVALYATTGAGALSTLCLGTGISHMNTVYGVNTPGDCRSPKYRVPWYRSLR